MLAGKFRLRYNDVEVYFGRGVLKEKLEEVVKGYVKALVITSKTAARVSGALSDVARALSSAGIEYVLYDKVAPNPYTSMADEAAELAESEGVDLILAVGGGSVIDVAKAASLLAGSKVSARDLVMGAKASPHRTSLVVVNLTHGTGSEVNRFAVLTIDGTIEKRGFVARYPNVSFDDPVYTTTLSRQQTIYTSLDAFYHAYESATSKRSNIMVLSLAEQAVSHIAESLGRVLEEPTNVEARARLLYASMIAGIAIDLSGGSHLNHALEHGLSGVNPRIPHGAGLAMLGPRVVYYTHKASPEASARLLRHLDPSIRPVPDDADKAAKAVEAFQKSLGFAERLSDYGLAESDLKKALDFVEKTIAERYHANMPFSVTRELLEEIARTAL
ncbi:MAG: iron-containing alcohol dehydrogenase [Desulfurococcaceae archaeon]